MRIGERAEARMRDISPNPKMNGVSAIVLRGSSSNTDAVEFRSTATEDRRTEEVDNGIDGNATKFRRTVEMECGAGRDLELHEGSTPPKKLHVSQMLTRK